MSVVASPRLTREAARRKGAPGYAEFLDWPETLRQVKLGLRVGAQSLPLKRSAGATPSLEALLPEDHAGGGFRVQEHLGGQPALVRRPQRAWSRAPELWRARGPVGGRHPTLLPWNGANRPEGDAHRARHSHQVMTLGDRTLELPLPGFDRFFDDRNQEGIEGRLRGLVFFPGQPVQGTGRGHRRRRAGEPDHGLRLRRPRAAARLAKSGGRRVPTRRSCRSSPLPANTPSIRRAGSIAASRRPMRSSRCVGPIVRTSPLRLRRRTTTSTASWRPSPIIRSSCAGLRLVIDCALPAEFTHRPGGCRAALRPTASCGSSSSGAMRTCRRTITARAPRGTPTTLRFTTRERTADHERGVLRLQDADDRWHLEKNSGLFDVYQVDPDGAALKTVDFLLTAQNLVAKSLRRRRRRGDLHHRRCAARRSAPFGRARGVAARSRGGDRAERAAAAALKDQAGAGRLRGGRIRSCSSPRTCCVATASTYSRLPGGSPGRVALALPACTAPIASSGRPTRSICRTTRATSRARRRRARRATRRDPDDHYLHESLFRWTGWSLVTPRPGRALRARTDASSGVQNEEP